MSLLATVKAQEISNSDLVGNWLFGKGKYPIEAKFKDDSTYVLYDSIKIEGHYSVSKTSNEYILTLLINTGGYAWVKKPYLIRKLDSLAYRLQVPKTAKNGKFIYIWEGNTKKNTYTLSRVTDNINVFVK